MYSSVKFLSPIVTAGLPTPGPLPAAAVELAPVLVVAAVELEELEEELPQAARERAAANARIAPVAPFDLGKRILTPVRVLSGWSIKVQVLSLTIGTSAEPASSCPASFSPRGVSIRCTPASANSTTRASTAMQMAAPSTPERW